MKTYRWNIILIILLTFVTACSPQPTKEVPQEFKKGQEYFHRVCSNCHGSDAMGGTTKAPRLIDTDFIEKTFSDDEIRETILKGTDKMPSQKNNVKESEISEIIKYLRHSQQAADLVVEEDVEEEEEESE
jgi:mono/diheme cytochrome c family protein